MKQTPSDRKLRTAALLLALLLPTTSAIACAEKTDEKVSTTPASESESTAETLDPNDRTHVKDDLPDNLDFDGRKFRVYCAVARKNVYFEGPEEQSGEIVDDAVLERNARVEERLKVDVESIPNDDSWDTIKNSISKIVATADDSYDLFMGQQAGITQLLTDNCFVNAFDLEYINFNQPWWNNMYMEALSLGKDYRFFLMGDYFIDALLYERVLYFNKVLYNNYYGEPNALYEEVLDGNWNMDRMAELSLGVYSDLNNNGRTDMEDQLGYVTHATGSSVDAFVYGTDIPFTYRDEDGFIELDMQQERAVTLAEKLITIFYQNGSLFNTDGKNTQIFINGSALFLGNASFETTSKLRDMQQDYGYLPYPKLDEQQAEYRSVVHDTVMIGAVSNASQNLDMAGAVLEALNAETYRRVTPVWYESALKVKYVRDNISAQMIDLIHDSMTTNFIFAYNYALGGIGLLYRGLVTNKSTNYISTVKSMEKAASRKIDKLVKVFQGEN